MTISTKHVSVLCVELRYICTDGYWSRYLLMAYLWILVIVVCMYISRMYVCVFIGLCLHCVSTLPSRSGRLRLVQSCKFQSSAVLKHNVIVTFFRPNTNTYCLSHANSKLRTCSFLLMNMYMPTFSDSMWHTLNFAWLWRVCKLAFNAIYDVSPVIHWGKIDKNVASIGVTLYKYSCVSLFHQHIKCLDILPSALLVSRNGHHLLNNVSQWVSLFRNPLSVKLTYMCLNQTCISNRSYSNTLSEKCIYMHQNSTNRY